MIFGTVGFIANTIAIIILTRHKDLSKYFFNWLLTATAINDNLFLASSIFVAMDQHFYRSPAHEQAYINWIYPVRSISLFASIYMMVLLSYERYKAVSQSTSYEGNVLEMESPWVLLFTNTGSIVLASFAVNISTFWELQIQDNYRTISYPDSNSSMQRLLSESGPNYINMAINLSSYRYSHRGVYRYLAFFQILLKTIIPILLLIYFNSTIYRALQKLYQKKRRMEFTQKPLLTNESHSEVYLKTKRNISSLIVLLSIVCLFVLCHALCPVHIISDIISHVNEQEASKLGCTGVKYWRLIVTTLSNFSIVVNASVNLFIYCIVNEKFKAILFKTICKILLFRQKETCLLP